MVDLMGTDGRIRILALVNGLPTADSPYRWVQVVEQVRALSHLCTITLVSPVMFPPPLRKYAAERKYLRERSPYTGQIRGVRFYQPSYMDLPRGRARYNDYSRVAGLLRWAIRERVQFDLLHAHFGYWPGYSGGILAKILRKPVVVTAYGSDIHQQTRPDFPDPLWRERVLAALKLADRIIAVSDSLYQLISGLGYGAKTSVVSFGFAGEGFNPMDQAMCRRRMGLPLDKKVILYVGNLVRVKGPDVAVDAFRELSKVRDDAILVIVGDGEMRASLRQTVKQHGLTEKVFFLGPRPNSEIPFYMNASDLQVVPSRNEGRPAIVMESLACGRPVVATQVGGIPELINDESLGILVEPENPCTLAQGISTGLMRTWDRARLHRHAQRFSWREIAPRIHRVYEEVLAS